MPILGEQGITVTVEGILTGQNCVSTFFYHPRVSGEYADPAEVTDWFVSNIIPVWQSALSTSFQFTGVGAAANTPPGVPIFAPSFKPLVASGSIPSAALPPQAVARLYKNPDSAQQEPPAGVTPFKQGMTRVTGISEVSQDNGILTALSVSEFEALAAILTPITPQSVDFPPNIIMDMHIGRAAGDIPGEPEAAVTIGSIIVSPLIGSQNSRKN